MLLKQGTQFFTPKSFAMYHFSTLFGTMEVRTEQELPCFSFEFWFEARKAGHTIIKSIKAAPQSFPIPSAPYLYQVEFALAEGFMAADLVAELDALAERYAEQHDQVLEPLEV